MGKSSVEVVVWLEQKFQGQWRKLTRALFLMASRNSTNTKALPVNALVPATDEEKIIFAGGESKKTKNRFSMKRKFRKNQFAARKKNRIIRQEESLFTQEPNDSEQKLIHDIFINTIDMKNLTFNKRILPKGAVWMEDGTMSNIIFSHPEDRKLLRFLIGREIW